MSRQNFYDCVFFTQFAFCWSNKDVISPTYFRPGYLGTIIIIISSSSGGGGSSSSSSGGGGGGSSSSSNSSSSSSSSRRRSVNSLCYK